MKFELSEDVIAQINELNNKVNELCGYPSNDIKHWFNDFQKHGTVNVGYRAACGSMDRTHKIYRLWLKAVKILTKNGVKLCEEYIKVDNKSPTMAQGFWNEVRYFLA